MSQDLLNIFLIRAIIYGMVPAEHSDILKLENHPSLKRILKNSIIYNYKNQFLTEEEKNRILDIFSVFRFQISYPDFNEKQEMYTWCNEMIGIINQSQEKKCIQNDLENYIKHGYSFLDQEISLDDYFEIKKEMAEITYLEYLLIDGLQKNKTDYLQPEYLIDSKLEHSIYYLIQYYFSYMTRKNFHVFLNLLELKKYLNMIHFEHDFNYYNINLNGECKCVLKQEQIQKLQSSFDFQFTEKLISIILEKERILQNQKRKHK